MMKKCKFCGHDIYSDKDSDGTYEEGYCNKFERKDHEKQLIKEGRMEGIKGTGFNVLKDTKYRDVNGELIHFSEPYYDRALQRTFHSKKEKCSYMRKNNLVMDGSSDPIRKPIEAGDTRFTKIR